MNRQERIDLERKFEQEERAIEATNRLTAEYKRVADALEVNVELQPGGKDALDAKKAG